MLLISCNQNEVRVLTGSDLNHNEVRIELNVLSADISNQVIYKNGVAGKVPNEYGENDWKIFYKDSLYFKFRHFKTNRNNNHVYIFIIDKLNNEELVSTVKIKGKDSISWKSK